jgi:hypothetical protein
MNEAEKNAWKEVREKCLTELREAYEVARILLPTAEDVPSPPPTREGLLDWATSTRSLRAGERREQVLRIVEQSLNAREPISVAEIFEAAYGDSAGREYWRLWLEYGGSEDAGALLATHYVAENRPAAHPLGEVWGSYCSGALGRYPHGQLVDRIRSILGDEELGYLIAPSARAFLDSGKSAYARPDEKPLRKRGRRAQTQVPDVIAALRAAYPRGPLTSNREVLRKTVEEKMGRRISNSTLDRARKQAWP